MTDHDVLVTLFEHDRWANARLLEACAALGPAQLDATPLASTPWSLRDVLRHIAECERGYLALLTASDASAAPPLDTLDAIADALRRSGGGLLALASDPRRLPAGTIASRDGHRFPAWVVMLQAINHAGDHRRQACAMLRALGLPAPRLDGWGYGMHVGAVVPPDDDTR